LLVNFGHYPKAQVERIVAERGRYENTQANSYLEIFNNARKSK
jgi:hypothetical protein